MRDFYHNFPKSTSIKASEVSVRVRGKQVKVSLAIIEEVLGLPHVSDEEEDDYFEEIRDLANITYKNPSSLSS